MIERALERALERSIETTVERAAAAPSYTGPLDLVAGAVWAAAIPWALSSSMLGQAAFVIKKLDGALEPETTPVYDATTGLVSRTIVDAFLDSDDGAVIELKDNSGNSLDLPNTFTNALWVSNVLNGFPGINRSGSVEFRKDEADVITLNGACTDFLVASLGVRSYAQGTDSQYCDFDLEELNSYSDLYEGATLNREAGGKIDFSTAGIFIFEAAWEFGAKVFRINGVSQTYTSNYDSGGALGSVSFNSARLTMTVANAKFLAGIRYPSKLSDADCTLVRNKLAELAEITL